MTRTMMAGLTAASVLLSAGAAFAQNTQPTVQSAYPQGQQMPQQQMPSQVQQRPQMPQQSATQPMPNVPTGTMQKIQQRIDARQQGMPAGAPTTSGKVKAGTMPTRRVPGTPNTGAGGNAAENAIVLGSAAVIALLGASYLMRKRSMGIR